MGRSAAAFSPISDPEVYVDELIQMIDRLRGTAEGPSRHKGFSSDLLVQIGKIEKVSLDLHQALPDAPALWGAPVEFESHRREPAAASGPPGTTIPIVQGRGPAKA